MSNRSEQSAQKGIDQIQGACYGPAVNRNLDLLLSSALLLSCAAVGF